MNINLTLGAIVFLLWSTFSSWYYVCQIKGLCLESTTEVETPIKTEVPTPPVAEPVVEVPTLPPISLVEDRIYFDKNSTTLLDPAYVEQVTTRIKSAIEGREVDISIVGYTCDLGRQVYNQNLGLRRAEAIQTFLEDRNIGNSKFEISSKGESEATPGTEEQRQKDRKVSITIKSTDQ
ncbi:OmpA family protein [Reichenbachiella faecimaris]|uniref:OmpA family protein n=1 Tax=Reichenbachiella faecimaris TaxID=692418 RepID=A0A1W2G8V5_REIFA|nr:OmpA family protein [Reichenbachiella faecimaris]SMD33109.1 OmpA family protein [Reichenbachiella faecimaris]